MKFRTEIKTKPAPIDFRHNHQILAIGSCFAANVGAALELRQFQISVNPFGIQFNPIVIAKNIENSLDSIYNSSLSLRREEYSFHFDFPTTINASTDALLESKIESIQNNFKRNFKTIDRLILTFGTAWVYRHTPSGDIIGNCHKQSQQLFTKELLDLNALKTKYKQLFRRLKSENDKLEIVLTVSPVRHIKNGIPEDQLSKSTLLLLCHFLKEEFSFVHYFPAYELVIDDLRDYRFYSADLIHPNQQAIEYVFDHFSACFFQEKTIEICKLSEQLSELEAHIDQFSTNAQINKRREHIANLQTKINRLKLEF